MVHSCRHICSKIQLCSNSSRASEYAPRTHMYSGTLDRLGGFVCRQKKGANGFRVG